MRPLLCVLIALGPFSIACGGSTDKSGGVPIDDSSVGDHDATPEACKATETPCGGACVDTQHDRANCGTCGNGCGPGEECSAGVCAVACPTGQGACGGLCVNIDTDPTNCGKCGNKCASGQVCSASKCSDSCAPGYTECVAPGTDAGPSDASTDAGDATTGDVGDVGDGAGIDSGGYARHCANLTNDPSNCGACGAFCGPSQVCTSGKCVLDCPTGYSDCTGSCKNLGNDWSNCGTCGKSCKSGEACKSGVCSLSCGALSNCGGSCRDLSSDVENCGTCGNVCLATQICTSGSCKLACGTLTDCSGVCKDTKSDAKNCGACGVACSAGDVCSAGKCTPTCDPSLTMCGSKCTSTAYDPANCGLCGHVCSLPNSTDGCLSGTCYIVACTPGYANCDGALLDGCEVNLASDGSNCGKCGTVCTGGKTCSGGSCI